MKIPKTIFDNKFPNCCDPHRELLKTDKAKGGIIIDTETTLTCILADAWEYKLGNPSALEWILDQYKESTPSAPRNGKNSTLTVLPTTKKR